VTTTRPPRAGGDTETPAERRLFELIPAWLVAIAIALLPAATAPVANSPHLAFLLRIEFVLLTVVLIRSVPTLVATVRHRREPPLLVLIALSTATLVGGMIHPSIGGLLIVGAAVLGTGMAATVARLTPRDHHRLVVAPLLAVAGFEALIMAVQWLTGRPWVLSWVDPAATIPAIDGFPRPPGTMLHVYHAAILGLVALAVALVGRRHRYGLPTLVGIGAATALVGMTNSRSGVLGLVLACGFLLAAVVRRREAGTLRIPAAIVAGFLVSLLIAGSGWVIRAERLAGDDHATGLGRTELVHVALRTIRREPLLGVGPARFVDDTLARGENDPRRPLPVHDVPLLVAAELGIPAALAVTTLLVWTGVVAWRRGLVPMAAFAVVVPFLLFDVNFYDRPVGLLLFGTWLGALALASRPSRPEDAEPAAVPCGAERNRPASSVGGEPRGLSPDDVPPE